MTRRTTQKPPGLPFERSTAPVERTIQEIQRMLALFGAERIIIEYERQTPVGMSFTFPTGGGLRVIQLPVPISEVRDNLVRKRNTPPKEEDVVKIAWRVAWSWFRSQMHLWLYSPEQAARALTPYMLTVGGTTVGQELGRRGYALSADDMLPAPALPPGWMAVSDEDES